MIKKYLVFLFLLYSIGAHLFAQDAPALVYSFPSHNNLQYNRFLLHPTFSYSEEKVSYVSLYHRNQWLEFDDSPKVYMASYSSSLSEKTGLAFGIYQQQEGVLTSWGGIVNYSYKVSLTEKMKLLLGFNLAYYNSGIDKARVIAEEPDPFIMSTRNNSILSIKPGISLQYSNFDFGVYAENYIDYDFKTSKPANEYARKTLIGHAYYRSYNHKEGMFGTNILSLGIRMIQSEERDLAYNGILLAEFPRLGWVQSSIEKFYGVSFGFGLHLTKRLSLGYTFEKAINEGLSNFGPTHEIVMVLAFQDKNLKTKESTSLNEVNSKVTLIDIANEKQQQIDRENKLKEEQQQQLAIENFKKQIDPEYWPLLEVLANEESFDSMLLKEKFNNLLNYINRVEATRQNSALIESDSTANSISGLNTNSPQAADKAVKELFKGNKQTLRETPKFGNQMEIPEMEKGIYIISNVFLEHENAEKFVLTLNKKGILANYFINPRNNLRYVYLKHFTSWQEALKSYYSNVDNTYFEPIWLLQINMNEKNKN